MTVEAYEQAQKDQRISTLKWQLRNASDDAQRAIKQLETAARNAQPTIELVQQLKDRLELVLHTVHVLETERPPHAPSGVASVELPHDVQLQALAKVPAPGDGFVQALPRLLTRA